MTKVFDIDGNNGRFAMYIEPTSGASDAPLTNPYSNLNLIKIHSDLNYLKVAKEGSVTINHPYVARPTTQWDWSTWSFNWYPTAYINDYGLLQHDLGYIPHCIIAIGENIVEPGTPVQSNSSGGVRFITIYATTTQIRAVERVDTGNGDLAAFTATYSIFVLGTRQNTQPGVLFEAEAGRVRAGQGSFDSNFSYLRSVAPGESPFYLVGSQNIDTEGGITKTLSPTGVASYDFYNPAAYTGGLTSVLSRAVKK